jgi:hypothetical protein
MKHRASCSLHTERFREKADLRGQGDWLTAKGFSDDQRDSRKSPARGCGVWSFGIGRTGASLSGYGQLVCRPALHDQG